MINKISIIIITLNEEKYLPKVLDCLRKQIFKGKFEVIVVDGGSSDKTVEIAKKYKNKIQNLRIFKTWADIGHQRNEGAKNAKYKHLLFMDADITFSNNLLSNFTEKINPEENLINIPILLPIPEFSIPYFAYLAAGPLMAIYSLFSPITSGGFILTTKKNHFEIGGFKEKTVAAEDVDYGERSVKNGAKLKIHYGSFVNYSTRRAKKMGVLKMFQFYLKGFIYYKAHGVLYDRKKFNYTYGDYL